jgi:DNA mismatch endonuclease (patch repair protein)
MKRKKAITSKIMSQIKSRDTKPEILFRQALWSRGVRFRLTNNIYGKPDIAIKKYKIAIFIDGDFWHGNNWRLRKYKSFEVELKSYSKFWRDKIQKNIIRDKTVNRKLKMDGWIVLRFWASNIDRKLTKCIEKTMIALMERGYKQ